MKYLISFALWLAGVIAVPVAVYSVTESESASIISLAVFLALSGIKLFIALKKSINESKVNHNSPAVTINGKIFYWWDTVDGWYCEKYIDDVSAVIEIKQISEVFFTKLIDRAVEIMKINKENNINDLIQAGDIKEGFEFVGLHIRSDDDEYLIDLQYLNPKYGGDMQWDYVYRENGEFVEINAGD